jgi:hypothetical protein
MRSGILRVASKYKVVKLRKFMIRYLERGYVNLSNTC